MDLAVIVGTRPEAIKLAPVVLEARRRRLKTTVVVTGQQPELTCEALRCFRLVPDTVAPPVTPADLSARFAALLTELGPILRCIRPQAVVVQGDTSSAFAGALAAFHLGVPVVHVEAGLRTGHIEEPFPEEGYRQALARLASLHCAPTEEAARNLLLEGVTPLSVTLTGNPIVDAVRYILRSGLRSPAAPQGPYIVVTAHRRENRGHRFETVVQTIASVIELRPDIHWLVITHPNGWFAEKAGVLRSFPQVRFLAPQPYDVFLRTLAGAQAWVSDSGGLQEEACCLGKPLLVLRSRTERQEAIEAGWCRLADPSDSAAVAVALERLVFAPWRGTTRGRNPFGDGRASRRIVTAIKTLLRARRSALVPARPVSCVAGL